MNTSTGTQFALGVAALFAASCDASSPTAKPDAPANATGTSDSKTATGKPQASKTIDSNKSAAKPSGAMPSTGVTNPAAQTVHCLGIHECKGKSACHVKKGHACAGQNDCKGKGWIVVPEADCEAKGGKIVES